MIKVPYPNESSCRLVSPDSFQPGSFRRIIQGKLQIIIGKLKGKSTTSTQAYRYPIADWTIEQARKHCKEAGGNFEPAKED